MRASDYTIWVDLNETRWAAYNALTGGLATFERTRWVETLRSGRVEEIPPDKASDLAAGGYVVEDQVDELDVLKYRRDASRFSNNQLALTIMPTTRCNFSCYYCYQDRSQTIDMSEDTKRRLIEFIRPKLAEVRRLVVVWFGGEPLLAAETIARLSEVLIGDCRDRAVEYSSHVVTNGYNLTPSMVTALKGVGVNRIQVTLDGPAEVHDKRRPLRGGEPTFETIVANLSEARRAFKITLRITVDRKNFNDALRLRGILQSQGLLEDCYVHLGATQHHTPACSALADDCFGWAELNDRMLQLLEQGTELPVSPEHLYPRPHMGCCSATNSQAVVVYPDGRLFKCFETVGLPGEATGSLYESRPNLKHTLKWMALDVFQVPTCRRCKVLPLCLGGCPRRWLQEGRPVCMGWKANLQRWILYYARRLAGTQA